VNELVRLFFAFSRIGAFTFGGGYAMLPLMNKELVEKNRWVSEGEMIDYFALSQCTPGVIAVNVATFVGAKVRGFSGALVATLGVIIPSFLIILVIASLLRNFMHLQIVVHAFNGIRVAVAVLLLNTVIGLLKSNIKNAVGVVILIIAFIYMLLHLASPIYLIAVIVISGLLYYVREERVK